jgi:3-hydroxyisobutyrate dehydrogenase
MTPQNIHFVGLGMMGFPMAARLSKAGCSLSVADADPERVSQFRAENPSTIDVQPGALDMLITMLPNSDIVESVLLGGVDNAGLAAQLKAGAIIIDMSSSEPLRSQAMAKKLSSLGLRFLDAPVSGGMKRAMLGTLAIMAGGDQTTYEACSEVLGKMGATLFHVGGPGAGHAMKALNNYVSAAGLVAAVEALQVGQRFGLDPAIMTDVINASTGRNNTTENKVKQFMLSGSYNSAFSLQLMGKDLGIAMQLGKDMNYAMHLGNECRTIWASAVERAGRNSDHTEMYHLLDQNQ